mmetsp:Transcript_5287/g.8730  ORF Transcript_5287/g.8730 Transcript_5287/m.8730 type:complete len:227 (+) Transcript_5287:115-795(+)|eukprot:CAMPEP_0114424132 /NCGR_PEP_ID=MMETSP0103-20121206/6528_1 /TAXON_ID=37642 ORGANISM="Paraphysomonas imperforata, Strain PA2" /NCGR_SAMPLE_ID=MMETSP0103 /ASSEMBLY_ACC=CAM_ASM_000201 /LENGTH=226 /DNA_ID=CAMNT_0001592859 /DNA_START=103 /DNA_END=786 /DNA_ORIENTATION=+
MASDEVYLTLVIKGARKLKNTQTLGLQDPYLRAWVSGSKKSQKIRTKTYVDGGSMAVWNESNDLRVVDKAKDCLLIEVKNENDFTSDTTIGRLKLSCADITESSIEDWYSIFGDNGDTAGEVHLSLSIKAKRDAGGSPRGGDRPYRLAMSPNMSTSTVFSFSEDDTTANNANKSSSADDANPEDDMETLPPCWAEVQTPTGCTYFVNEDTKVISWVDPRKSLKKQF